MTTLLWYRGKDLRVTDHEPLREALRAGDVIPVFVLDPYFFAPNRARSMPHRIQFLVESIHALDAELQARGSQLIVLKGKSTETIPRVARAWGVDQVMAQRWCEPFARRRDAMVTDALDVPFRLFEGEMLIPPESIRSGAGRPYSVFGAFRTAFERLGQVSAPKAAPRHLPPVPVRCLGDSVPIPTLRELGVTHNGAVAAGGEHEAGRRLRRFLDRRFDRYHAERDRLDLDHTSRLSADLKFGTLSVRRLWHRAQRRGHRGQAWQAFRNELIWRDFAHSTLWDFPDVLSMPCRSEFETFPWADDEQSWQAWVEGRTGYPVVDAAAHQLRAEGFVHGRARMIAASFLTKHLLVDYRRGEAHYQNLLTDGDWAQNNFNWQWCAGCGMDAQPYFRVFNPVLQGKKFDPDGAYVRRWLPQLAGLPARFVHTPWEAPPDVLSQSGLQLDRHYHGPIVEHRFARERFLAVAREHLRARKA